MVFIKIVIFMTTLAFARTELLEFTAKQSIHNIRYILKGQDSTFYTKGVKTLAFSSNYKSFEVLSADSPTEYTVIGLGNNKTFLIEAKHLHHSSLNPLNDSKIYLFDLEKRDLKEIGNGTHPQFHLKGKYISFYNFNNSEIRLIKADGLLKFENIKINSENKYYVPQVSVFDEETIIYTDLNNLMIPGILKLDITKKKRTTLYKAEHASNILEFCKDRNTGLKLFILESSYNTDSFSNLYSIKYTEEDISKRDFLLDSKIGPAHSMMCESDNIFMIKKVPGRSVNVSELLRYDLKKKKLFILTDLKFVQSFLKVGKELLVPFRDKIYHLKNKKGEFMVNKELVEKNE